MGVVDLISVSPRLRKPHDWHAGLVPALLFYAGNRPGTVMTAHNLALKAAVRRTSELFLDRRAWTRMQRNGMVTDVSWRRPAQLYAALYRDLLVERATRSRRD